MDPIDLPSGAKLRITLAPFKDGRALYQAIAEEIKDIDMDASKEIDGNFLKGIFCAGVSSKKIEAALDKCLARCLYDDARITDQTFEPELARGDYFDVVFEVARANVLPFTKSLYAKYSHILEMLKASSPA